MSGRGRTETGLKLDFMQEQREGVGGRHRDGQETVGYGLGTRRLGRHGGATIQSTVAALSQLYHPYPSMESLLRAACRIVVDLLSVEHCSICWIEEKKLSIQARTSHTREGAQVNPHRAVHAITDFIESRRLNRGNYPQRTYGTDRTRGRGKTVELTEPLRVDKRIVGYIYAFKSPITSKPLSGPDKSLFVTLSNSIGTAIEIHRAREMLDYPCIASLLSPDERNSIYSLSSAKRQFLDSIDSPEKLVKKIARQFFRDLRKAGFETKHILSVATEIIDNLSDILRIAKAKR